MNELEKSLKRYCKSNTVGTLTFKYMISPFFREDMVDLRLRLNGCDFFIRTSVPSKITAKTFIESTIKPMHEKLEQSCLAGKIL